MIIIIIIIIATQAPPNTPKFCPDYAPETDKEKTNWRNKFSCLIVAELLLVYFVSLFNFLFSFSLFSLSFLSPFLSFLYFLFFRFSLYARKRRTVSRDSVLKHLALKLSNFSISCHLSCLPMISKTLFNH